jgi:alkanesulfonate monooxygenase SsuD/methylene tetrahydromethanopterin reductase-like flavin-dependent oxidoreductase (luciferase family)
MVGVTAIAADTDEQAAFLATSLEQAVVNLRSGRPGRLPPPRADLRWAPHERAVLDDFLGCSAIGSPATVRARLASIVDRTHADELIIASQVFEHAARLRSHEIVADVLRERTEGRQSAGASAG